MARGTDSTHTKFGVVATLHLIGINSTVAGRHYEFFVNGRARLALLELLEVEEVSDFILRLISRDPWYTDISYLMNYLEKPRENYYSILGALQRYQFADFPFNQPLPHDIPLSICIEKSMLELESNLVHMYAMRNFYNNLVIDEEITSSEEWRKIELHIPQLQDEIVEDSFNWFLEYYTNSNFLFSYDLSFLHDNVIDYYYAIEEGCLTIYEQKKAREIWLSWWKEYVDERK